MVTLPAVATSGLVSPGLTWLDRDITPVVKMPFARLCDFLASFFSPERKISLYSVHLLTIYYFHYQASKPPAITRPHTDCTRTSPTVLSACYRRPLCVNPPRATPSGYFSFSDIVVLPATTWRLSKQSLLIPG